MLVREVEELLAFDRVPHTSRKVGGRRCGVRGGRVEARRPHGAFVALESANPVARLAVAQHGLAIFRGRDQEHTILGCRAKLQLYDWPRVAVAHERGLRSNHTRGLSEHTKTGRENALQRWLASTPTHARRLNAKGSTHVRERRARAVRDKYQNGMFKMSKCFAFFDLSKYKKWYLPDS